MKKMIIPALLALSLAAGQYAKLKDGTIIILKDDGTWEKVETVPQGTEVAPEPTLPKEASAKQPAKEDPYAKEYAAKLVGIWESADGRLKYIVTPDEVTIIDGRKKRAGHYRITQVDPAKRTFMLNVGEYEKVGWFSFGGMFRKMAFSADFRRLTDYSAAMPTELRKVK